MGAKFGDPSNPLLVSVRSGARASMPGMMDTILNLGLNDKTAAGLAAKSGNERFAYDSYRRFIAMYGDVVLGLKPENKEDHDPFDEILDKKKKASGVKLDSELSAEALKELVAEFKAEIKSRLGIDFPEDPYVQLEGAIKAVFQSWRNDRADLYRRLNNIPVEWGTAVNVQAMVFGNKGGDSATGVCFTRDPGQRREHVLRRVPGERAGRGRRRRHPHAAEDRGARQGAARRPTRSCSTSARSSRSTTRTCRTSSSPSRTRSSTCFSAATGSAPGSPACASPSRWSTRS